MHRAILAWLCDVPEIRRSIVDEHGLDDTDEEMNKRECDYMISKNEEGNQLTKSDLERMRKKTGQLIEENKKVDQLFDSLGISMKDFGAVEEEANFSYDEAITNMKNALTNNTVSYYIGTSKWELYSSKLKDVLEKNFYGIKQIVYDTSNNINEALENAHCAVAYTSGSSIDAILEGVPVIPTSQYNFVWEISSHSLNDIENPKMGEREQLLYNLAYAQWSVQEIQQGKPWEHLYEYISSHNI